MSPLSIGGDRQREFSKLIRIQHLLLGALWFIELWCLLSSGPSFSLVASWALLAPLTLFSLRTLKDLYYSFWTFSGLIMLYCLCSFFILENSNASSGYFLIFLGFVILLYLVASPLYYPRVNWWESDFRYRGDIVIDVTYKEKMLEGRLTDLRRQAGCVVLFDEIMLGEELLLKTEYGEKLIYLTGEVVSRRETLPGRGITYGFYFKLENEDDKKSLNHLRKEWKDKHKLRMREKFKKEDEVKHA